MMTDTMIRPVRISQAIRIEPLGEMPRLAVLDACEFFGPAGIVTRIASPHKNQLITRINVPREHRGKGYGNLLLKQACAVADLTETTLFIETVPYTDCPLTLGELMAWYKRNGFRDFGGILRRSPS